MVALSVLPYLLILLYLLLFGLHSSPHVKAHVVAGVVTSALALVIKEVVQQDRPEGACTHSYGMPSNHVALMASFAVINVWMRPKPWFALCITITQCLVGTVLGSCSALGCLRYLPKEKTS